MKTPLSSCKIIHYIIKQHISLNSSKKIEFLLWNGYWSHSIWIYFLSLKLFHIFKTILCISAFDIICLYLYEMFCFIHAQIFSIGLKSSRPGIKLSDLGRATWLGGANWAQAQILAAWLNRVQYERQGCATEQAEPSINTTKLSWVGKQMCLVMLEVSLYAIPQRFTQDDWNPFCVLQLSFVRKIAEITYYKVL